MNSLERFKRICRGEKPDYYPIFGIRGAPGFSGNCLTRTVHDRLVQMGMPDVGGVFENDGTFGDPAGWNKYWGVSNPMMFEGPPMEGFAEPLHWDIKTEDGFEILTCETGAVTRQVINNNVTYSMPEFISFHVHDRKSWERYKERCAPGKPYSEEQLDALYLKYKDRTEPLLMGSASTYGALRGLVGPYMACTIHYDDPELARDIYEWHREYARKYVYPVIKKVKPDIMAAGEDISYNHGMLISPKMFNEFCAQTYVEAAEVAKEAGVTLFAVDSDGFVEELVPLLEAAGVNGLFPWEVKAGNNLMRVREKHPEFIMLGGIEKEILNEGNGDLIRPEIMGKVPQMLKAGRYFPNGDHGMQPYATYENLLKTMTLLHEVCENPEGDFPRVAV